MNKPFCPKHLLVVALTMGLVAGCASTQTSKDSASATAPAQVSTAVTKAISDAKVAIGEAKANEWIWRDTEKYLADAEKAAAAGDEATALKMANKAADQAREAINQYYLEKAKAMMQSAQAGNLTAAQNATLREASAAIVNAEGRKSYDLLSSIK